MKRSCIIVAGGNGSRMGSELPKQFLPLEGLPVLMHTILNFHNFDPTMELVVVLPEDEIESWQTLCMKYDFDTPHQVVKGGNTRFQSVKNGLSKLMEYDLIAIHDGVRPLVSNETLIRCFETAAAEGAAIPVLPANESVRQGTMERSVPVDRSHYFMVQTPQIFKATLILESYTKPWIPEFTDDASVAEHSGVKVHLVEGNRENIKITFPEDLQIAELFLKRRLNLKI